MGTKREALKQGHRQEFERNKKKIYASQEVCGICGQPVDKSLKYPHPLSKTVDHIIPVIHGGHYSDIDNLQLAHLTCNRQKSDKFIDNKAKVSEDTQAVISNRILPHSVDWMTFKPSKKKRIKVEVDEEILEQLAAEI